MKGPTKKTGKVIHQNPKAGRVLAPGATIAIKLVKQPKVVAKQGLAGRRQEQRRRSRRCAPC